MRRQVDEMLEAQIIEPSESPWSSPVVLVAKSDGTQRFCVDYRALNKVAKRDLYPRPRRDDILESLAGAQWFSHLDLTTEGHVTPRVHGAIATLDPDAQSPEVPYAPEVPSVNNESSQIPVRPRRERREPS